MDMGMHLKCKNIFLVVLLFLFLLIKLSYGGCPVSFEVQQAEDSCQDVCNQVWTKASSEYNDMYSIGPSHFGEQNDITYFPNICTCVFVKKDNNTINKALYCTYNAKISGSSPNSINELVTHDVTNAPSDIPSNLVRMFIFSQKGNFSFSDLSAGGSTLFSGMYTVYTFAIKDITTMFALLLVMIITGWAFGLYVLENLMNVLKAGNPARLENMISVDLKKKAKQVLIAVIVFGLPVPTNNFILKSAGIGMSSAGQQALSYNKCQSGIINPSSAGQDYCNVNTANACQACQSALAIIPQNCKQIKAIDKQIENINNSQNSQNDSGYDESYSNQLDAYNDQLQQENEQLQEQYNKQLQEDEQLQQENSGNASSNNENSNNNSNYQQIKSQYQYEIPKYSTKDAVQNAGKLQVQMLAEQNYNAIVAYNTCTQNYIQMNQDINNQSNSNQYPSFLKETPEDVHLPLAVAIVDGFINTGLSYAKTVGNYTSNVIENYIIQTMLTNGTGMLTMNQTAQTQQLYAMRHELQDKEFIDIQGDCFNKIKNCTQFRSLTQKEIAEEKEAHKGCGTIYYAIKSYCDTLSPGDLVSKIGKLDEVIDEAQHEQHMAKSQMSQALNGIRNSMSWLSPAVLPLTAIYLQVGQLYGGFHQIHATTDIEYEGGGSASKLSRIKNEKYARYFLHGLHEFGSNPIGTIWNGIKAGYHWIANKVTPTVKLISSVASSSGKVGWQVITGGQAGSRVYYFGRILGVTSIPPGNMIKSAIGQAMPSNMLVVGGGAVIGILLGIPIPALAVVLAGLSVFYSIAKPV
ncbi:MAG: hypothetical protein QXV17_08935, partial [Candidatus Micrarchaeaceae archaeon]